MRVKLSTPRHAWRWLGAVAGAFFVVGFLWLATPASAAVQSSLGSSVDVNVPPDTTGEIISGVAGAGGSLIGAALGYLGAVKAETMRTRSDRQGKSETRATKTQDAAITFCEALTAEIDLASDDYLEKVRARRQTDLAAATLLREAQPLGQNLRDASAQLSDLRRSVRDLKQNTERGSYLLQKMPERLDAVLNLANDVVMAGLQAG